MEKSIIMRYTWVLICVLVCGALHAQTWQYTGPDGATKRDAVILTGKTTSEKMTQAEKLINALINANSAMVSEISKLMWDKNATDADRKRILEQHWQLAARRATVSERIQFALRHVQDEKNADLLKRYQALSLPCSILKSCNTHFTTIIDSKAESNAARLTQKYPATMAITHQMVDTLNYYMTTSNKRWFERQNKK